MIEVLKQALEALESGRIFVTSREKINHPTGTAWYDEQIESLRQAIAELESQEPVATIRTWHKGGNQHAELWEWELGLSRLSDGEHKLYTTPQPVPQSEPVAWGVDWGKAGDIPCVSIIKRLPDGGIEVMAVEYAPYSYTHPPQRKPLTDGQIYSMVADITDVRSPYLQFARAIEAAHGIKE